MTTGSGTNDGERDQDAQQEARMSSLLDDPGRRLLYDLVSIPSPSGKERKAAKRLAEFFHEHGRDATIDQVGNVRAPADDVVLLTGHLDTVPGSIPVRVTEDPGGHGEEGPVLWGRGSVDATGALAAMALVAVRTGVSFAGLVGEETDSRGARHLVRDREPPESVINGEPSGWDAVTLGYRGFLSGTYRVKTEAEHDAAPGSNAIELAMDWREEVVSEEPSEGADDAFKQVAASPVEIEGGRTDDGLATKVKLEMEFRIPPSSDIETVQERAEGRLVEGTVEWNDPIPPWEAAPRTSVARAFRVAIRQAGGQPRLLRKTGTADANLFAASWNVPTVVYGPGDSAFDHAPDERLPLPEFDRSVEVLQAVCDRLSEAPQPQHSTEPDSTNETTDQTEP